MEKRKFVWPRNFKPGLRFIDELGKPMEIAGDVSINENKIVSCSVWPLSPDFKKKFSKTCKFFEMTNAGMIRLYRYATNLPTTA